MGTALVTGTSTGIGQATAVALARAGHDVVATMRNPAGAPELQNIAREEGLPVKILPLDVDDDDSVRSTIDEVLDANGRIDTLVNNAGIGSFGAVVELPLADFRSVMETNYFGALRCIQAVAPAMRAQKSGCIINITSVAGRIAGTPSAAYTASKHALEAASEALAQEVKQFGIRVAIVEPGVIATPIFDKLGRVSVDSPYSGSRRIMALFRTSLENPVSPYVVGEKVKEIAESDSWQLRYPVGPDAAPFLQWRADMTDEEWIDWWAVEDDEAWCALVERDFEIDVRPQLEKLKAEAF